MTDEEFTAALKFPHPAIQLELEAEIERRRDAIRDRWDEMTEGQRRVSAYKSASVSGLQPLNEHPRGKRRFRRAASD